MQKHSSYIETEQCYLFRVLHFNRQNLMLITPPYDQATAYGTCWKYLAEYEKIVSDVSKNVFLILVTASSGKPTPELYVSCQGG